MGQGDGEQETVVVQSDEGRVGQTELDAPSTCPRWDLQLSPVLDSLDNYNQ